MLNRSRARRLAPSIALALSLTGGGGHASSIEDEKPAAGGETTGRREPNRLIEEKSPYLLQHAYNPVDWYPWGEEAFRAARESGKPVFLSIGYSTCHWCHVMERESFENPAIAARLNEHFVSIKVDREERPDVDAVYMQALLRMRGSGGWPLSAFLTPGGKPFFLGSYFPPEADPRRPGLPGFSAVLDRVVELWRDQRQEMESVADRVAGALDRKAGPGLAEAPWRREQLESGFHEIDLSFDRVHAGFASPPRYAPKFPRTSVIDFLLAHHRLAGEEQALEMSRRTLARMLRGGIYDQLGDGFHRYSVDREWLVPHFEKMLYDNCLVPRTYLHAFQVFGEAEFLDVARRSLDYLLRDMRAEDGGFCTAEDADSEGKEGKYYVFDRAEVISVLGEDAGRLFADRYGISEEGNFHDGWAAGEHKSVLHVATTIEELAEAESRSASEIRESLEASRRKLLAARARRVSPMKDDKVLTDWNGLAISALATAYAVTGEERFLAAARETEDFVARHLTRGNRLLHRYRDGEARHPGYLEDYAFLVVGLLDLYEASLELEYLEKARRLTASMIEQFWDEENGGFYQSGPVHEQLFIRTKDTYDGAVPSGNSVAARNLVRLVAYTGDPLLRGKLEVLSRFGAALLEQGGESHSHMLFAAATHLLPRVDVVLVGPGGHVRLRALLAEVRRRFLPARTLARVTATTLPTWVRQIPWLADVELGEADGSEPHALVRRGDEAFRRVDTPGELASYLDRFKIRSSK